jgi:aryl-phospho-beta-D-glucosidase BglC (GH1 family)
MLLSSNVAKRFLTVVILSSVFLILFEGPSRAAEMAIVRGSNIIGIPGLSSSDFSACGLAYYDSKSNLGCTYRNNGYFVYYVTDGVGGDCGGPFFTSASMSDGHGYYVSAGQNCTISFTPKLSMDVPLLVGNNIISVPVQTTEDQISAVCGSKDLIFKSYDSSSNPGCRYADHGHFVFYNGSDGLGDCGGPFHSSSVLLPNVGYYVDFLGVNGDGATACGLRYVGGVLSQTPVSVTSTTSTTKSTTTTVRSSSTSTRLSTSTTINGIHTKPYVEGIRILDADGTPLVLRGFNIAPTFSEADIAWLASHGYNSIRLTATWAEIEPTENTYDWSKIDNVVSWCNKYGIKVLLDPLHNWHFSPYFNYVKSDGSNYGPGLGFPSWLVKAGGYPNSAAGVTSFANDLYSKSGYGATSWGKFVAFWRNVTTRYRGNGNIWAYEIINEPLVGGSFSSSAPDWLYARYGEIIPIMRGIDPDTIIICHDVFYSSSSTFVSVVNSHTPLPFSNLVWTRSFYLQYEGTNSVVTIDNKLNLFKTAINGHFGIPHIISETGFQTSAQISTYGQSEKDLDNEYRKILNGGTGVMHDWQYALGTKGGFMGPRNTDGSDSLMQPILTTWIQ